MILGLYKGSLDDIVKMIKEEIKNGENMVSNKE